MTKKRSGWNGNEASRDERRLGSKPVNYDEMFASEKPITRESHERFLEYCKGERRYENIDVPRKQ